MISSRIAASALAVTILLPTPVAADPTDIVDSFDFGVQCLPAGVLQACAHVSMWSEVNPPTDDYRLWVEIRNMEGQPGFEYLPPDIGLGHWSIGNLALVGCDGPDEYGLNGCDPEPEPGSDFFSGSDLRERLEVHSRGDDPYFGGSDWETGRLANGQYRIGYGHFDNADTPQWGCTRPSNPYQGMVYDYQNNCERAEVAAISIGGAARFAPTRSTYINLSFAQYGDPEGAWTALEQCSTGAQVSTYVSGDAPLHRCTGVPEPSMGLLMLSGLLGLGWRRRPTARS